MRSDNAVADSAVMMVLDSLASGPRSVPEMPRAWPVTRAIVRGIVRALAVRGLIEEASGAPVRRWRLTASGRAAAGRLPARAM